MTAYYNEIEPNAAAWLRTLIAEGHIAPGHVDERSIVDVRSADLDGYCQVHFFAGIGGWSLALRYAGWPDSDPVWTGSCPCQPFSLAGRRGGFDDSRHLWPDFRRLISERRPAKVFGEQVASAADWLRLVRSDLEAMDYAVGAIPIEAASAGADHLRDRFWFVGDRCSQGLPIGSIAEIERGNVREEGPASPAPSDRGQAVADATGERLSRPLARGSDAGLALAELDRSCDVADGKILTDQWQRLREEPQRHDYANAERSDGGGELSWVIGADGKARRVKSGVRLLAHGVPNRVGLLRGFGNAIDPRPAAAFIKAARLAVVMI
jgi:DNA (cytosine-5)-methyltransferase 1